MKRVLTKIGVDRSIFLTVTNRIILAFGSLLTIYFISKFLTKAEQGYYYTFGSLAALQVFFELGLSIVITQFVAHEFAFLTINANQEIEGSKKNIARLSSLLHFMTKWYLAGAAILFILVMPAGLIFFYNFQNLHEAVSWKLPWILLVFFTALNLLISSYVPYLEGLNKIKDVAQFRVMQGVLALLVLCICLRLHFGLYSLGIVAGVNFISLLLWIATNKFKNLFVYLWKQFSESISISWKKEILPFQWKIGLSWLSGYFIFQFFNPLIFAFEGPVVAGQLGITLAAFNGISVIAMAWINTKIATFSMQIAKKDYEELDNLFFLTLRQSVSIIIFLVMSFLSVLYLLQTTYSVLTSVGLRFLPVKSAIVIGVTTIVNQVIFSLATYLRCHKEEPLFICSLVGAVCTLFCSYFFAKWFGVFGMLLSNCLLTLLLGLVWVTIIFFNKRKLWHQVQVSDHQTEALFIK
ncbi:MAG: hypothetical protein WKF91_00690 [Segetibacter sp.]